MNLIDNNICKDNNYIDTNNNNINLIIKDHETAKIAVNQNGLALQFVEDQTDDICIDAIKNNFMALKYVKTQTFKLCMLALFMCTKNCSFISLLNNQEINIVHEILKKNPEEIQYVHNQTYFMCELVLKKNGLLLKYVKPDIITLKLCKIAILNNGLAIKYVPDSFCDESLCILALKQNTKAIKYIKNRTTELWTIVLKKDGRMIKYLNNSDFVKYDFMKGKITDILLIFSQIAINQNKNAIIDILNNEIFNNIDLDKNIINNQKNIANNYNNQIRITNYLKNNTKLIYYDDNLFDLIIKKLCAINDNVSNIINDFIINDGKLIYNKSGIYFYTKNNNYYIVEIIINKFNVIKSKNNIKFVNRDIITKLYKFEFI